MSSVDPCLDQPASPPSLWPLNPEAVFLNHGSFGSCPLAVLEYQRRLREQMEHQPVVFLARELESRLDVARSQLATFLGADPANLVFVPNATNGVNTVLRSLRFEAGDELLVTDHEYNACRNALDAAAQPWQARVVVVRVPFPVSGPEEVESAILKAATSRTRLALLDHVTSQTALVLPLKQVVHSLRARGIETLVDGAHAPGMVTLDLEELGAAYYTGNCHKWLCAPKGAAFLYVRPDCQQRIRPLAISHGANSPRTDRPRIQIEFGWTGTSDPTAALSVPEALRWMGAQRPGGWPEVRQRNRSLAMAARRCLCEALNQPLPCPDSMLGAMASLPVPDAPASAAPPSSALYVDAWQERLWREHQIEVPVIPWPEPPRRLVRISCQLYNAMPQYRLLASKLLDLCRQG